METEEEIKEGDGRGKKERGGKGKKKVGGGGGRKGRWKEEE